MLHLLLESRAFSKKKIAYLPRTLVSTIVSLYYYVIIRDMLKLFKIPFLLVLFFSTALLLGATEVDSTERLYSLYHLPVYYLLSYDQIKMPQNDEPMGLLGLTFSTQIRPGFNAGIASYGAITGNQGGLFTLGIAAAMHLKLMNKYFLEAGAFIGGGGGKVGTGDGLMIRRHVSLKYTLKRMKLGIQYSDIDFPDSQIHGQQIGISLDLTTQFTFSNPGHINQLFTDPRRVQWEGAGYINFNRYQLSFMQQSYFQKAGTKNIAGVVQDGALRLVGFEAARFLRPRLFILLKTAGAYGGIHHGYMDVLAGIGYLTPIIKNRIYIVGKLNLGAGGGGHVETGGGFLIESSLGIIYTLLPLFAIQVGGGYLNSLEGNLKTTSLTAQLCYRLELAQITEKKRNTHHAAKYFFQAWSIRIASQTYKRPERVNRIASDDVHLVSVKASRFFNTYLYLTGQGYSAYSGQYVGGLAVGLVGIGVQHKPLFKGHFTAHLEILVGAAGGGHLALGEGAIMQLMLGLTYQFNPIFGLQVATGRIRAFRHQLESTVLDVGIIFNFTTLARLS
ncbi:MAG: hypothetical protein IIB95_09810 [Candidatus Marinimicrobia bacterium]|nr:hypothetical protein [Candidatus Neomarinimicrobiota bacterium]